MPSVLNFKNDARKRRAYSYEFLSQDLLARAQSMGDQDFLSFQLDYMEEVFPHFRPDCFSVCLASYESSGKVISPTRYAALNHERNTDRKYVEFRHLDVMDPFIYHCPGNAIYNTHFKSMSEWCDDAFYQGFKVPLGLHHTVLLSFHFPFRSDLRVRFSYQTLHPNMFSDEVSKHEVEFYTLPFYYSWLYRYGAIDDQTLERWLNKLVGITPLGLSLLRDMCTSEIYSKSRTAEKWHISKRVIDNQFYNIYSSIRQDLEPESDSYGYRSQLVDLTNYFSFLRFSGNSQTDQDVLANIPPN